MKMTFDLSKDQIPTPEVMALDGETILLQISDELEIIIDPDFACRLSNQLDGAINELNADEGETVN